MHESKSPKCVGRNGGRDPYPTDGKAIIGVLKQPR